MIDVKPQVYSALTNDNELVSLLGGKRVYQLKDPNATEFPRITFFEVTHFDSQFADDQSVAEQIELQIDIWTKGNFNSIAAVVDRVMQANGFRLIGTTELYEDDTQVYHKAMRYRIQVEG
jgi:hypothetical protein